MSRQQPTNANRDDGTVLILVLVMMVIGSLVVIPMIAYTSSVFRAGNVQLEKARAVQTAKGGTWVALNDTKDLYDNCNGGLLPSSIQNLSVRCEILETKRLRDPADVPFAAGVVQSDAALPSALVGPDSYVNPNSTAVDVDGWDDWLSTPDWSNVPQAGKVWLPQLPVQATTSGGTRDTRMIPGSEETIPRDYRVTGCRVFFPGTFSTQIVIDEPAYFTSGVYYFTEPLVLESGADVVVGDGIAPGCTTDFAAIASAVAVPDPLNMSGLGGSFVLGGRARIIVDDSAGGDIRFAMNQRYVSTDETSVAASSNVSIVSVNGTHVPLFPSEVLGDDLLVAGSIAVPASTVGTTGDPLAALENYEPSALTPKPSEPDAPTNVQIAMFQENVSNGNGVADGLIVVTWDPPNDNGALINEYVATDSQYGLTCSPRMPTEPHQALQPSCTISGVPHSSSNNISVTVEARNDAGWSPTSLASPGLRMRLTGGSRVPQIANPTAPQNPAVGTLYSDGIAITWTPPASTGGSAITSYVVTATDTVTGTNVICEAWWDETSCVLRSADGLTNAAYDVKIEARTWYGAPPVSRSGAAARIDFITTDNALPAPNPEPDPVVVTFGPNPAPIPTPLVATQRVPDPILDFSTTGTDKLDVRILGYVSVPQGHVRLDANNPANKLVAMIGGIVAGQVRLDGTGQAPAVLDVRFDNPVAQKRVRITSTVAGSYKAVSETVVQINRSGSIGINSWIIQ